MRLAQEARVATATSWSRGTMPLSERKQNVITEAEESLSRQDTRFFKSVIRTTLHACRRRFVHGGVVGFILGLLIKTPYFTQSVLLGLMEVAVIFVSVLVIQYNSRRPGHPSRSFESDRTE